jgi:aspartyl-tRNA(Asn)/glutamyl-tRNA(Gln) amidotransferase subunit A
MRLADSAVEEVLASTRGGELSSMEVLDDVLDRLDETEPVVRAYSSVLADEGRARAGQLDAELLGSPVDRPLRGLPVSLKDLIATEGVATRAGSRVLRDFVPAFDAEVVRKLRAAGAVIVGKAVTHEFAYGLDDPPTGNAWDPELYPGGSSAGSGVSVAVGSALASLGTDSGGSGRVPAALNGIVSIKPTFGAVSTHGVIKMSESMDAIAPMARTARGCALVLDAILDDSARPRLASRRATRRLRIGFDRDVHYTHVAPAVRRVCLEALDALARLGHDIVPVTVPQAEQAVEIGSLVVMVDTSNYHRELIRDRPGDYHPRTRAMLQAGELLPGSAYVEAQRHRRRIRDEVRALFVRERIDVLAMPTHPVLPVRKEDVGNPLTSEDVEGFARALDHTILANLIGLPAVTVPVGFADAMPVGLQVMGRPYDDFLLLEAAAEYQAVTDWHTRRPDWVARVSTNERNRSW